MGEELGTFSSLRTYIQDLESRRKFRSFQVPDSIYREKFGIFSSPRNMKKYEETMKKYEGNMREHEGNMKKYEGI